MTTLKRLAIVASLAGLLTSCSVALQDSVRSSGVYCSTSRFYIVSDVLLAGTLAYLAASYNGDAGSFVPAGAFAASALIGVYKRGNCVRHRESATPEEWAHDSEAQRRDDDQQARVMRAFAQQLQTPAAQGTTTSGAPPTVSGTTTMTINGRTYTDHAGGDLGKPCGLNDNSCSTGYACVLVTSSRGMCAPE